MFDRTNLHTPERRAAFINYFASFMQNIGIGLYFGTAYLFIKEQPYASFICAIVAIFLSLFFGPWLAIEAAGIQDSPREKQDNTLTKN